MEEKWTAFKRDNDHTVAEARRAESEAVRAFIEAKAERDRAAEEEARNRAAWFKAATAGSPSSMAAGAGAPQLSSMDASMLAELEVAAEERIAEAESAAAAAVAEAEADAAQRVAAVEAEAAERLAAAADQVAVAEAAAVDLAQKLAFAEDDLEAAVQDKGMLARLEELEAEVQSVRRSQQAEGKEAVDRLLRELEAARSRARSLQAELAVKSGLLAEAEARGYTAQGSAVSVAALEPELPADGGPSVVGNPTLGGTLRVTAAAPLTAATFQWFRVGASGSEEPIAGATRHQYAPEPMDCGCMLLCSVQPAPGMPAVVLLAPGPIVTMEGLSASLAVFKSKPSTEFNVVVVQRNGEMQDRREARAEHCLCMTMPSAGCRLQ